MVQFILGGLGERDYLLGLPSTVRSSSPRILERKVGSVYAPQRDFIYYAIEKTGHLQSSKRSLI